MIPPRSAYHPCGGALRGCGAKRSRSAPRVSVTWYTWLEQGRGGSPSADVLDRKAHALALEDAEREHLYFLAQGRAPEMRPVGGAAGASPRLQLVLDALRTSPALVRTAAWDVIAWNEAAAAVLIDYALLAPEERNVLRLTFCHPRVRAQMPNWEPTARFVVASFRAEITRAGATKRSQDLVSELTRTSPEFAVMWSAHDVCTYGEGTKVVQPEHGERISLEYSSFAVDGQPGLGMVVYTPAKSADAKRIRALIAARMTKKRGRPIRT